MGSAAILAIIPAIPVFIVVISVASVVIGVITYDSNIGDTTLLKYHHRTFQVMLSYVQSENPLTDNQLIENVYTQIIDIHSAVDYTEPLEFYIRRYKLNGYEMEADERINTNKSARFSFKRYRS